MDSRDRQFWRDYQNAQQLLEDYGYGNAERGLLYVDNDQPKELHKRKVKVSKEHEVNSQTSASPLPLPSKTHSAVSTSALVSSSTLRPHDADKKISDMEPWTHAWPSQYNELVPRQRILARKLILDILYYGCLEQLDLSHVTQLQQMLRNKASSSENEFNDMEAA